MASDNFISSASYEVYAKLYLASQSQGISYKDRISPQQFQLGYRYRKTGCD